MVCSFIMFYIQIHYVYEILKLSLQISHKHAANLVDISVQVKYVLSIDHSEPPSDAEARAWLLRAYACVFMSGAYSVYTVMTCACILQQYYQLTCMCTCTWVHCLVHNSDVMQSHSI